MNQAEHRQKNATVKHSKSNWIQPFYKLLPNNTPMFCMLAHLEQRAFSRETRENWLILLIILFSYLPTLSHMREVSFILMGSFVRVKVWRIKPYIRTNGKKVAGVSHQIRGRTTQDRKDLPNTIFSPWNCHFLKSQHTALPGHGIPRHLGFKPFAWRKWQWNERRPQGNVLEGSMCEDVAISQALVAIMTLHFLSSPTLGGLCWI